MDNKLFIIIQARMTSTRLPKKVMLPLCGKSVLEIMLDRLGRLKNNIIIATTNDGSEEAIIELCKQLNIKFYQGSTDDVLSRYYYAASRYGAKDNDIIVRLTSDCPLIDKKIVYNTIEYYKNNDFDYVSNRLERKVPLGLDTEVFNFKLLRESYINAKEKFEKEHVTPYIYLTNKRNYSLGNYAPLIDGSMYRLTLDEVDDYNLIKAVYKEFDCSIEFSYEELIQLMQSKPYLYKINQNVQQKVL
jgi:spore coat polysaccharide biosynthesis protein SpsF